MPDWLLILLSIASLVSVVLAMIFPKAMSPKNAAPPMTTEESEDLVRTDESRTTKP